MDGIIECFITIRIIYIYIYIWVCNIIWYVTVLCNISVLNSNLIPRIMNPCVTFCAGICVYSRCILPTLLKSWWFRTKYVVLLNMQTSAIDLIRWIDLFNYLASTKTLWCIHFITNYNLIIICHKKQSKNKNSFCVYFQKSDI